jgi:hypothetical protein
LGLYNRNNRKLSLLNQVRNYDKRGTTKITSWIPWYCQWGAEPCTNVRNFLKYCVSSLINKVIQLVILLLSILGRNLRLSRIRPDMLYWLIVAFLLDMFET